MENQIKLPLSSVASQVISTLEKSARGVSYVSIKGYENAHGEIANVVINVGLNYGNVKESDLNYLKNLDVNTLSVESIDANKQKTVKALLPMALSELIQAQIKPNKKKQKAQIEAYTKIEGMPQVKVHNESGKIFVVGYKKSKTIIKKGDYGKPTNSKDLTLAKNIIRKGMKVDRIGMYSVSNMNGMNANGDTLEFIQRTF